jgi:hypothetical protein
MKLLGQFALVILMLYFTSYVVLRSRWTHRWEKDGLLYMEFPTSPSWVYSFFRPLCLADEKLSGMRFHMGPHPEPAS